ncbi:hypothetical protein [Salinispira pacifica]
MRRVLSILVSAAALAVVAVPLHAVTIANRSEGVFYYVVRKASESELAALKATPQAVAQYLLSHQKELSYVPPGGTGTGIDVGTGPAALLGFFVHPGDRSYPVTAVFVSPSDTEATFAVDDTTPAPVSLRSIDVSLGNEPILIDNRYLDWLKVPNMATYPDYFVPRRFIREQNGTRTEEPIARSLFWKKGGTQIQYFKSIRSDRYLYLLFSSASELSKGLSYMLYLYKDRNSGAGKYTIEIPVDRGAGLVTLWQNGKRDPEIVGDFVHSTFFLEARLRLDQLPSDLASGGWSIDLATMMQDAGVFEEFYFSTLFVRDIPK